MPAAVDEMSHHVGDNIAYHQQCAHLMKDKRSGDLRRPDLSLREDGLEPLRDYGADRVRGAAKPDEKALVASCHILAFHRESHAVGRVIL
jgi:hypothetical protein